MKPTIRFSYASTLLILALACSINSTACRKASPPGKRYELKGKVISVDQMNRTATIAHEDIKDFMPAMTMEFRLKDDATMKVISAGDQVTGTLVVDGISSWIEDVIVTKEGIPDPNAQPAKAPGPKRGDEVPDFRLTNQDGNRIHLTQYHGQALALTFIYTRCPLPEYCTLMSNKFHEIDQELQQEPDLYARTHLLTVTIDPEYDTPQVLRSYGSAHTERYQDEKFEHWEFATGSTDEVRGLANFFGMRYFHDSNGAEDQIEHALLTAVVGPDGKVFKVYAGNEWQPAEVIADLKTLSAAAKP